MGLNEAAGYLAVAATALATGYLAAALRAAPRTVPASGVAFAALGLGLSALAVRETRDHARLEAADPRRTATADDTDADLTDRQVFTQTSFREPALSAASQAGLVNNLNDGLAWGLFPVLFAAAGLSVGQIGVLAAALPGGLGRSGSSSPVPLSDRVGPQMADRRRHAASKPPPSRWSPPPTPSGPGPPPRSLLGAGTAMVYPTLLAAIGDVAHPAWRARAVGVYRLWRDGGFAVGALLAGLLADLSASPRLWRPSPRSPPPPAWSSPSACLAATAHLAARAQSENRR